MEQELSYGFDSKTSRMQVQGFYPDTDGQFESFVDEDNVNVGYVERMNLFSKKEKVGEEVERVWSKESVYLCGHLPTDLNSACAPIVNGVNVRIEMVVQNNEWVFCSKDTSETVKNARFILEEVLIHCPIPEMNDIPATNLIKRLQTEKIIFQFRRR